MSYLQIILGFAFLIFIHELGHFLVARWCGIRCPQFAVGMGQAVLAWRKGIGLRFGSTEEDYKKQAVASLEKTRGPLDAAAREKLDAAEINAAGDALGLGQTEYRLNWLPIGGYVKMLGQEDTDPNAKSADPAAFGNKSAKARAAVLLAGVVMNLVTGLVFFVIAFSKGVEFPSATVGFVAHESPAEKAGIREGDKITAIDGKDMTDFMGVQMSVVLAGANHPIRIDLERAGKKVTLSATPEFNAEAGMQTLGIGPSASLTMAAGLDEKNPFAKAKGATIVSLNGAPVADHQALEAGFQKLDGKPGTLAFSNGQSAEVQPELDPSWPGAAGILPATQIKRVSPGSPAERAGIKEGDVIIAINGVEWPTIGEVHATILAAGKSAISLKVRRGVEEKTFENLHAEPMGKLKFLGLGNRYLGIQQGYAADMPWIGSTGKGHTGPNIPRGSWLQAVDGQAVENWLDIQRVLMHGKDAPSVKLQLQPNVGTNPQIEDLRLALDDKARKALGQAEWLLPEDLALTVQQTMVKGATPLDSIRIGIDKTQNLVIKTYTTITRLLQGSVGAKNINGVVGIVQTGAAVAETGDMGKFLYLLGAISINLAVMNLLPLPVLDGGHLVFLAIEKITGKPLHEKVQTAAFIAGIALIGSLMLFAFWNDLARVFGH